MGEDPATALRLKSRLQRSQSPPSRTADQSAKADLGLFVAANSFATALEDIPMTTENDVYEHALCEHLEAMLRRMRRIPPDKWQWSPAPCAPSARDAAQHAWAWLVCDRAHITEPDVSLHERVPEPPDGQQELCEAFVEETENWRALLIEMTPARLAEPRSQFGLMAVNVRWFVYHMLQHVVYKSGQLAAVYFALGLAGDGPYTAPAPNEGYAAHDEARRNPLLRAIIDGSLSGIVQALQGGADIDAPDRDGDPPLKLAVCLNAPQIVALLLERGARADIPDSNGATPVRWSDYLGHEDISAMLRAAELRS